MKNILIYLTVLPTLYNY